MSLYESGLTLNKICIDSRFRSPLSRSDSDFSIELPEAVYLPLGTRCYVCEISIVHAWYTIEENINDKLYFSYTNAAGTYSTIITLSSKNYDLNTLAEELQLKLSTMQAASPEWVQDSFNATVDSDNTRGTISISNGITDPNGKFFIWSDADLGKPDFREQWTGGYYDPFVPQSINKLIKNYVTQTNNNSNPFTSGFVDTMTHHNIYIKSPQLGAFQNIGPQGERDILKKVVVDVPFGQLITDNYSLNNEDFTDCSRLTLKTLNFRVTDVYNNTLKLNGHHVSFSLIFSLV